MDPRAIIFLGNSQVVGIFRFMIYFYGIKFEDI